MPLTSFQAEILRLLAHNRSPDSYVAGGIALNAAEDVFHDVEEAVVRASDADVQILTEAGCSVERELWSPAYRRAWISRRDQGLKLEWCQDSAWRFFPIESDPLLGWRLHRFDAITNKALALAGRSETRDVVDLVANAARFSLHATVWAACAKDAGYTPPMLLNQMMRNSRIDAAELREMGAQYGAVELKREWLRLMEPARDEIERAIAVGIEPGVVFVAADGAVGWLDSADAKPHRASLGGAAPRIADLGDL